MTTIPPQSNFQTMTTRRQDTFPELTTTAVNHIRRVAPEWLAHSASPLLAVILGSGLSGLADGIEITSKIRFDDLPGLPAATASGHRSEFLLGHLAGIRVVAMAGRLHAYEGHSLDSVSRGISLMAALHPSAVIVSCAAGGLNPRYRTGDLVIIDEHISLLYGQIGLGSSIVGEFDAHRCGRPTCDPQFAEIAEQSGRTEGDEGRVHRGTYLAVNGPNYETRAECRMMKNWGADLVGMSTVPEVVLSSRAGLRTIAIGVVTNMAVPDAPVKACHDDVLAVSTRAGALLRRIVVAIATTLDHDRPRIG